MNQKRYSPHQVLDLSNKRRALAVGDIHGEYDLLIEKLHEVSFDPKLDVLISVGDLCDRGPDSEKVLSLIDEPWFFRVLGNHDVVARDYLSRQMSYAQVELYGGQWLLNLPRPRIQEIAAIMAAAPITITVHTPGGRRIGIVHADCMRDWDKHNRSLQKDSKDRIWTTDFSLESRQTFKTLLNAQQNKQPFDAESVRVANIDHVIHGHCTLGSPFTCANRTWIDTGACMGGDFTIVNLDTVGR